MIFLKEAAAAGKRGEEWGCPTQAPGLPHYLPKLPHHFLRLAEQGQPTQQGEAWTPVAHPIEALVCV